MQMEVQARVSNDETILTGTISMGSESYLKCICMLLIIFTGGGWHFFFKLKMSQKKKKKSFMLW